MAEGLRLGHYLFEEKPNDSFFEYLHILYTVLYFKWFLPISNLFVW